MTEKLHISWEEFHRDTRELCAKIKNSGNYDKIVAVSRGGLLPAGILAYELNIRNTAVVNMSTYDGDVRRAAESFQLAAAGVGAVDEHTLVVDDLSDSGNTCNLLRPLFRRVLLPFTPSPPAGARLTSMPAKCLIPGSFFPGIEKLFRQSVFCLSKDFF